MANVRRDTDRTLGIGLLLGTVAGLASVLLFVASLSGDQVASGWGFAAAVAAAALAVVALHVDA